jgi:endonuclease/exonuclease/phosphatase (EEP) superfamily protein YafD
MQRGTSDWRLAVSDASHGTPIAMLENNLRILQLNTMKSRAAMEALINDHQSQKLDVLLIQEPSITAYQTHVNHSDYINPQWRAIRFDSEALSMSIANSQPPITDK